jgi:flagellar hook assembly protein FlgD
VSIHDLAGRQVRVMQTGTDGFRWDGQDENGRLLPPGLYIVRISLNADVGEQTARRLVNLVY